MAFMKLSLLSESSTFKQTTKTKRVIKLTKLRNFQGNAVMAPGSELYNDLE